MYFENTYWMDRNSCMNYLNEFEPSDIDFTFDRSLQRKLKNIRRKTPLIHQRSEQSFPVNHSKDLECEIQQLAVFPVFFWFSSIPPELRLQGDKTNLKGSDEMIRLAKLIPEKLVSKVGPCDISRMCYDRHGEVKTVVCPQLGFRSYALGALNVELTVQRVSGWVNDSTKKAAVDLDVTAACWINEKDGKANLNFANLLKKIYKLMGFRPTSKKNSILVKIDGFRGVDSPLEVSAGALRHDALKVNDYQNMPQIENEYFLCGFLRTMENTEDSPVERFVKKEIKRLIDYATSNVMSDGTFIGWNIYTTKALRVEQDEFLKHSEWLRESLETRSLFEDYYRKTRLAKHIKEPSRNPKQFYTQVFENLSHAFQVLSVPSLPSFIKPLLRIRSLRDEKKDNKTSARRPTSEKK